MSTPTLFSPLRLGAMALPNRLIMAPLTRMRARGPGNVPWELNAEYYCQRATAGLIISEATPISPTGHGYFSTPGMHTPEQAEGWKLVTRAVHDEGGRIFLQLWHVGRQSHQDLQTNGALPISSSALATGEQAPVAPGVLKDHPVPRSLATEEVPGVVAEYRHGAILAREAGFDGVEIHAANGYLIEQFLSDGANRRTDRYGGSLENRARFLLEVTAAVTEVWGGDRVGIRLSPANTFGGIVTTDRVEIYRHVVGALNPFRLAYLHLVEPRIRGNADIDDYDEALSSQHFRPLMTGETRLISAGGHTQASAEAAVASGRADAVAFGRAYIANPDLVRRFREHAPLNPYQRETFYGGGAAGYTDYPSLP